MPFDQYPSPTPQFPDLIRPPRNGDGDDATQINVDDLQPLQNGVEAARMLTYGASSFTRRTSAPAGGTSITIMPLGSIAVRAGAGLPFVVLPMSSPVTIDLTTIGLTATANTRWNVYAKNTPVAGVPTIAFVCNQTAADAGHCYAAADETLFFVCTVWVNTGSALDAYSQADRRYTLNARQALGTGARGNLLLDSGNAVVTTAVSDVNSYLPPNVLAVKLSQKFVGTAATDTQARLFAHGGTMPLGWIENDAQMTEIQEVELAWTSGAVFDYDLSANTSAFSVWIGGFTY